MFEDSMLSWTDGEPNVVDPNDGRTPVHLAAWKGHGKCLKLLLSKGGDLSKPDLNGYTPISLARDPYCLSLIVYLLCIYFIFFVEKGLPSGYMRQ